MCVLFAETMEGPFQDADLVPTLQKMLDDPVGAVEVKFSTIGLICSLTNSSQYSARALDHSFIRCKTLLIIYWTESHHRRPPLWKTHASFSFSQAC